MLKKWDKMICAKNKNKNNNKIRLLNMRSVDMD